MLSAEMVKTTNEVSRRLFRCTVEEQVDAVFQQFNVDDFSAKKELLRTCMGVKEVYASPETLTDEQIYRDDLICFLEGSWRLLI
jgi:hypothetical protein